MPSSDLASAHKFPIAERLPSNETFTASPSDAASDAFSDALADALADALKLAEAAAPKPAAALNDIPGDKEPNPPRAGSKELRDERQTQGILYKKIYKNNIGKVC